MGAKVLSIEIGKEITKVVEMDFREPKAKIYNCFSLETPAEMIQDGSVMKSSLFISRFREELSKRKIHTRKAVFVVSSSRITGRDVTVPQVKPKWLRDVVDASASDFFPGDMSQYHLVYRNQGNTVIDNEKRTSLNVLAVPNDLTASYFDLASGMGLELQALDYVGNAVMQTVGKAVGNQGTHAILKIEEESTLVTILRDGKQSLQRMLNFGVSEAIAAVQRNDAVFGRNLSTLDAIHTLCGKTVLRRFLNVETAYTEKEDTSSAVKAARIDVTESLRYLIGNVSRVLEYYTARNGNVPIDAVEITGLGADFSGLSKLFSNELNQRVRVFLPEETMNFVKRNEEGNPNSYAACIGAGMAPLNLIPERGKNEVKKAGEKAVGSGDTLLAAGIIVCALGVVGAVLLYLLGNWGINTTKLKIKKVQNSIDTLAAAGVEEVYDRYNEAKELNAQIQAIYDNTRSRSEEMVAFIEELEEKLPSDLLVLSFTASPTGVTMSIECDSKETAAKTLMQLREFESIDLVSSSGLTDSGAGANADGEDVAEYPVAFSVDCVYKSLNTDEELSE